MSLRDVVISLMGVICTGILICNRSKAVVNDGFRSSVVTLIGTVIFQL